MNNPEVNPVVQQLMLLRETTRTTGVLFGAQVDQVKAWAWGCAPNVRSYQIFFEPERWRVRFALELEAASERSVAVLNGVARSVRWLLGDGWDVEVTARVGGVDAWSFEAEGDARCRATTRQPR